MAYEIRDYKKKDKGDLVKLIVYLQNFESDLEPDVLNRGDLIVSDYLNKLLESKLRLHLAHKKPQLA